MLFRNVLASTFTVLTTLKAVCVGSYEKNGHCVGAYLGSSPGHSKWVTLGKLLHLSEPQTLSSKLAQ